MRSDFSFNINNNNNSKVQLGSTVRIKISLLSCGKTQDSDFQMIKLLGNRNRSKNMMSLVGRVVSFLRDIRDGKSMY